jgi:hypothetical protein
MPWRCTNEHAKEPSCLVRIYKPRNKRQEVAMGLGRAGLFWLLGVPIPIIILLMLFWR